MRTSIIVVGYRGAEWIPPLLESLRGSVDANDVLVIVDNFDNRGTIPADFSHCKYEVLTTDEPLGFCDANNFALEQMTFQSDLVCFLNQDVVVAPEWLTSIKRVFDSDPTIGALSPVQMTYDFRRLNPNFRSTLGSGPPHTRLRGVRWFSVDNLIAAAMFVRTDVLQEVGSFDPIFGSYCEDYDLCRRIREAGYKTGVVRESRIGHFDGSATTNLKAEQRRDVQTIRNWTIHKIRSSESRFGATVNQLGYALPRRWVGALLRRRGCKHPISYLKAYASLLRLLPRLLNRNYDQAKSQMSWRRIRDNLTARRK